MKLLIVILFLLVFTTLGAKSSINSLANESSPYLQAHKTNPINWYPWSKEAFEKAKREDKAIFLSIGYSTCHWCHVMEEESFRSKALAKLFNKYFIAIKVDREEMPHVDTLYQRIYFEHHARRGGWPLSVFMTPQKEVFYIGSYIPPKRASYAEGFDTLLLHLAKRYSIRDFSFYRGIKESSQRLPIGINLLGDSLREHYDDIYGGFGVTKKFPEASKLSLMMDIAALKNDSELNEYALNMLDVMALKGLYDHVEGGFFRYSVDAAWETPHFEKMLYTQAELIPLYVRGYLQTDKRLYRDVIVETIEMLEKRFKKEDLYYSASDADSKEGEGSYFLFTKEEVAQTSMAFVDNFEGKMHINFESKRYEGFIKERTLLQRVREKRDYPFIDKKINLAWNALMIKALFKASIIDIKYAQMAEKSLDALIKKMFIKGELYHQTLLDIQPKQKGLLEDYSFLISALIAGYEVDYEDSKLAFATYLLQKAQRKFYKKGVWYLSDDGVEVRADLLDKYYVSPLSNMLINIIKLASLKSSFKYEKLAKKILKSKEGRLSQELSDLPALAKAYLMMKQDFVTIKSNRKNLYENRLEVKKIIYPYILTKKEDYEEYLACTLRRCFSKEKELKLIIETIKIK